MPPYAHDRKTKANVPLGATTVLSLGAALWLQVDARELFPEERPAEIVIASVGVNNGVRLTGS